MINGGPGAGNFRFRCVFTLLLLAGAGVRPARAGHALLDQCRQYFEWGEYAKLRRNAEAFLLTASDTTDSFIMAECHKYLGVAYGAQGKIADAREQFSRAYGYNRAVDLDKYFVSQEIFDLFFLAVAECRMREIEQASTDSLLRNAEEEKLGTMKRERKIRREFTFALSCYSAAALLGAVAAGTYLDLLPVQDSFFVARDSGRQLAYNTYKHELRRGNYRLGGLYAGTVFFLAGGTWFIYRMVTVPRGVAAAPRVRLDPDGGIGYAFTLTAYF
jgi:tetratricopeptide (TPR) repeat protein